jgi:hypothetical protein
MITRAVYVLLSLMPDSHGCYIVNIGQAKNDSRSLALLGTENLWACTATLTRGLIRHEVLDSVI